MDISKASNFERFVFDLLGRSAERTRALFGDTLAKEGRFDLSGDPHFAEAASRYGFVSGKSTHADRLATIQDTHKRFGTTIDTHTADGVKVAREHLGAGDAPMGAEHEHAHALFAAHRVLGCTAGVAAGGSQDVELLATCLLYTSDAADE